MSNKRKNNLFDSRALNPNDGLFYKVKQTTTTNFRKYFDRREPSRIIETTEVFTNDRSVLECLNSKQR